MTDRFPTAEERALGKKPDEIKPIDEKVVWPKIAHTLAKLKPFVIYNETQVKLTLKDVFVNERD